MTPNREQRIPIPLCRRLQRIRPEVGMPVWIRVRDKDNRLVRCTVERVGPQVEPAPAHQQRDPKVREWGQPICIQPPAHAEFRPGELVDVRFDVWYTPNSG